MNELRVSAWPIDKVIVESAQRMKNIEFWQALAVQFRDLGNRAPALRANWTSSHWNEPGKQWHLSGVVDKGDYARFEILAERAVVQLGHPAGPEAYIVWLDLLRRDGPTSGPVGKLTGQDLAGNVTEDTYIHVGNLCGISAEYCLRCESRTMAEESQLTPALANCEITSSRSSSPIAGGKSDKGNVAILRADGKWKRAVTLEVASRFGGIGKRAIEKAATKGGLKAEGNRTNRRITVESLLKYFPPENDAP